MNNKRILIALGISCVIMSWNVHAAGMDDDKIWEDNSVIEEIYTYYADVQEEHTYPEVIIQGENKYQLESVRYETEPVYLKYCQVSAPMWKGISHNPQPTQKIEDVSSRLLYTETEEWIESGRTKYVSVNRQVLYGDEILENIEVETDDTVTGEIYEINLLKTAVQEDGAGWRQNSLEIPVIFMNYGNENGEYEINGTIIHSGTENPEFENYKELLLAQNELDPALNRITAIIWDGEAYENENGVRCRNAKALGDKLVPRYRVTYQGEVFQPDLPMIRYMDYYESEATGYLITAHVRYQLADEENISEQFTYMEIRICVVIILQLILGISSFSLLLLVRHRETLLSSNQQ